MTLALWKAVVFMEGNYKRAIAGTTDDPYLKTFGDGVVQLAQRALEITRTGFQRRAVGDAGVHAALSARRLRLELVVEYAAATQGEPDLRGRATRERIDYRSD